MDSFSSKDLKYLHEQSDEHLVQQYQAGSKQALNALLTNHQNNLQFQTRRRVGRSPVPIPAVHGQAMKILVSAANSYDQGSGVQFKTFLDSHLRGLNRFVNTVKSAVHLPENKSLRISKFKEVERLLEANHGNPPTDAIMADALGWSIPDVQAIRRKLSQKELAASGLDNYVSLREEREQEESLQLQNAEFVYFALPPKEKEVYDYLTGRHGKTRLKTDALIAQKTRLTPSQVYQIRKRIGRRISNV